MLCSSLVLTAPECSRWTVRCPAAKWPVPIVETLSFFRPWVVPRRFSPLFRKRQAFNNRSQLSRRFSRSSHKSNRSNRPARKLRSVRQFRSNPSLRQARGSRSGPYRSFHSSRSNRLVGRRRSLCRLRNSRRRPSLFQLASRLVPSLRNPPHERRLPSPRRAAPRPARDRYRCLPLYQSRPAQRSPRHRRHPRRPPAPLLRFRPAEARLS